jgi:hypothetical protein
MKYARVSDQNIVIEVFTPPSGFGIADCFYPSIAQEFEACPDQVDQNWLKQEDGSFTAPVNPEEPETP